MVPTTASSDDRDLREPSPSIEILLAKLHRISGVELGYIVEFSVIVAGRVRPDTAAPPRPLGAILEHVREVRGMRAVVHVGAVCGIRRNVDFADGVAKRLAGRQATVSLGSKRYDGGYVTDFVACATPFA